MPRLHSLVRLRPLGRHLTVALVAAQLVAGACTRSHVAGPGAEPVRTNVRVRFTAPRALVAVTAEGDTFALPARPELHGQLTAVRGDTLVLQVRALTPEIDRSVERREGVVRVVRQPGDRVEWRRFDARRTAFAVLGTVATAAVALVVAFLIAAANGDLA